MSNFILLLSFLALVLILCSAFFQYRKQPRWAALFSTMFVGILFVKFRIDKTMPPQAYRVVVPMAGALFVVSALSLVMTLMKPVHVSTAAVAPDRRRIIMIATIGIAMAALFVMSVLH